MSRHAYPEIPAGFIPLDDLLTQHRESRAYIGSRRFCRENNKECPRIPAADLLARAALTRGGAS